MNARLLCSVLAALLATSCTRPREPARVEQQGRAPETAPPAAPSNRASGSPAALPGQLAKVRPPPAPCLPRGRDALTDEIVEQAWTHYSRGEHARALACADEALRADPRLVPALHYRATALAALGRVEEAKVAFARALAVDPDDAQTLHGAAELYVTRLDGERESLLIGREYALRGARLAGERRQRDADLASKLLILAAMAENDLGESRAALRHADEALRARPKDANAHYERGVALYELCRFEDARGALQKANALSPDDPWTLHYLGLVEEHRGDGARAEQLLTKARQLSPAEFSSGVDISRPDFDAEVKRAIALLPAEEQRSLSRVPLELADVPALEDLTAVDPPLSPTILGLYRGPAENEPCGSAAGSCRSIVIYRRNLSRYAHDRAELGEQLRVTLLHELGHLHGENDDELRDRGLE